MLIFTVDQLPKMSSAKCYSWTKPFCFKVEFIEKKFSKHLGIFNNVHINQPALALPATGYLWYAKQWQSWVETLTNCSSLDYELGQPNIAARQKSSSGVILHSLNASKLELEWLAMLPTGWILQISIFEVCLQRTMQGRIPLQSVKPRRDISKCACMIKQFKAGSIFQA